MAETRIVPVIFQGRTVPGVKGEVTVDHGRWILTLNHLMTRDKAIKAVIRQIPDLMIPRGHLIRTIPDSITGDSIEYELYNDPSFGSPLYPVHGATPLLDAALSAALAFDPSGKPLAPVLNGLKQELEYISIEPNHMNIIDHENIANGDDIVHFLVGRNNYYYKTVSINEWFITQSQYDDDTPLQLPELVDIAHTKSDPTLLPGVVIRRGIARVKPAGGKRRNRKTIKKSKKRKTMRYSKK